MQSHALPRIGAFRFLAAAGAFLLAAAAFAAPTNVLIRVPAGTPSPAGLPELLSKWRDSGRVSNVLLLMQGRGEKPGEKTQFESLAVLEFPSENSADLWQRESAPALPAGLVVRRADNLVHFEITPRDSNKSIFVVNT